VARVVGRLHLLPRWCAGLRRVRFPSPAPGGPAASVTADATDRTCVFTYAVTDVRLTLRAHTSARGLVRPPAAAPTAADSSPPPVTHIAAGDGLTLVWTLAAEPSDGPAPPPDAAGAYTRLGARVEVHVDAAHPLTAARAAVCRAVARRGPADLERLRALIDRHEGAHAALPGATSPRRARAPSTSS
jgi:hypothetical protein